MEEGDRSPSPAAPTVITHDVFNPKLICVHCGATNEISNIICWKCGLNVHGQADENDEEKEKSPHSTSQMIKGDKPRISKRISNMFSNKVHIEHLNIFSPYCTLQQIAEADPAQPEAELVPVQHNLEGMEEIADIRDFLQDDNVDEGRRNRNNNNNNLQNINIDFEPFSAANNRPLFTTIFVIYWLYYLIWFIVGIGLTFFSPFEINSIITVICMILPSLIVVVLISWISCLNTKNLANRNYMNNLSRAAKQKYKLRSVIITVVLMFGAMLRCLWWIYCIVEYVANREFIEEIDANRMIVTLITLSLNEFGVVFLINMDHIKMSYFEKNKAKQGLFGVINDPYPPLISLSALVCLQLWILTYGAFAYQPESCEEYAEIIFDCGLGVVYFASSVVVSTICIAYGVKMVGTQNEENDQS